MSRPSIPTPLRQKALSGAFCFLALFGCGQDSIDYCIRTCDALAPCCEANGGTVRNCSTDCVSTCSVTLERWGGECLTLHERYLECLEASGTCDATCSTPEVVACAKSEE